MNRPADNDNAAEDTRCSPHSQLQPSAAAIPASASHPSPQPRCPLTTQPRDQIGEQSLTYKKRGNYVGGFDLCRRATWRKGRRGWWRLERRRGNDRLSLGSARRHRPPRCRPRWRCRLPQPPPFCSTPPLPPIQPVNHGDADSTNQDRAGNT
jgi:hypothetical protein